MLEGFDIEGLGVAFGMKRNKLVCVQFDGYALIVGCGVEGLGVVFEVGETEIVGMLLLDGEEDGTIHLVGADDSLVTVMIEPIKKHPPPLGQYTI